MSRTARRTAARLTATAAALGAAAVLSACSFNFSAGTPDYAGAKLADDVQAALVEQNPGVSIESVTCEDTPTVEEGETTACHGLVDGTDTALTVSWEDSDGTFAVSEA